MVSRIKIEKTTGGSWRCRLLFLIMACGFLHSEGSPDRYESLRFEHLTSIHGLSNNTVYAITQDEEGYIWIATRDGLNKFDGQMMTSYYHRGKSGLPGNLVERVILSSSGKLFIATQNGLCTYIKEKDLFKAVNFMGNSLGDPYQLIRLYSGDLLISSVEGLFQISSDTIVSKISPVPYREICEYKKGLIWCLWEDEIHLINTEGEMIRKYSAARNNSGQLDLSAANIECIFKDSRDILWLGTKRDGLGYYDPESDRLIRLNLKPGVNQVENNFIRVIFEDNAGILWIGTESGLYLFDVEKQKFSHYGQSFIPFEKGLNDKAIYSIFQSKDSQMWIGTYFGGVNYTNLVPTGFYNIYADGGQKKLSGNAVSEIIETSSKKLWIGTEDGGVNIYDPLSGSFEYLKNEPGNPNSLSSNNIHAFEEDAEGNIWIGTFIGGLYKYISRTGRIIPGKLVPPSENLEQDVYSKSIFSIHIDSRKRIWVGSIGGLYLGESSDEEFRIWNSNIFYNNFVYHISEDSTGNIWVCTYENGLYRIKTDTVITHYQAGTTPNLICNKFIFSYIDSGNIIWFGTIDGGLVKFDLQADRFVSYTTSDGLPDNTVYAITKDSGGMLWFSSNRGITMFDPLNLKVVNYSENDGLIGNQFNFKSGLTTSDGRIYFGAVNGLTYFDPRKLVIDENAPDPHFTDLKIFNNSVRIGEQGILSSQIDFQDEIEFKHSHKVITIEYVAPNFTAPGKTQYAYYLEGLETNWNYVGNKRSATYTNLSPGRYVFHLKASNNNRWPDKGRTLLMRVNPPFYLSIGGFLLFGAVLLSVTLLIIRFYMIRQREKMNIRLARLEKEKNEEIIRHRMNFFTYISHEFKTPLTLIIATLEHIMNYEDILPKFKDYGAVMRKNAMRLLFLINQLMDFRRIETDHAALNFHKGDIVEFIRSTFMTFNPLLQKKSISARFTSNTDSHIVYFDFDKLEKILTNLISNSCKSFMDPGTLSVDVKIAGYPVLASPSYKQEKTGEIIISITDDGPGISPDKLKFVFEPFEARDPSDFHSSGIGLSLVNSLVKYLKGEIRVNNPSKGTSIIIQLPLVYNPSPELVKSDSFISSNRSFTPENASLYLDSEPEVIFDLGQDGSSKEYEILVVEDNRELASFLCLHFKSAFKVQLALDGEEGLKKIRKSQPDLVISDIMMPRMDGFALCKAVKESIETSHIPVILLTSKADDDSRFEGLYRGADVYVSKPFRLQELDLQIRNIIRARANLRKHFSSLGTFHQALGTLGNRDQSFIRSLTDAVNKNIDNTNFDVDMLCREVGISRTLLHLKIKKIAGLSTTEFIKKIRLNEARKMLEEHNYTVSEIAYRVGFSDPSYFSKAFKKEFNRSPKEVMESREAKNPGFPGLKETGRQ